MTIDASLNERLRRVVRKHERMKTHGVVHRIGKDGLIHTRPRLIRPQFPLKGAAVVLGLFFMFKATLFAQLGAADYGLRVETLRTGTVVEQMGAVLMQKDPLTIALSQYINTYFL